MEIQELIKMNKRYWEYQGRVSTNDVKKASITKKIAEDITQRMGDKVLLPDQIKITAFLLGYNDSMYHYTGRLCVGGPYGVSDHTLCNDIIQRLPAGDIINLQDAFGRAFGQNQFAYKRKGVERVFQILDTEGKLAYSPEKFAEALGWM